MSQMSDIIPKQEVDFLMSMPGMDELITFVNQDSVPQDQNFGIYVDEHEFTNELVVQQESTSSALPPSVICNEEYDGPFQFEVSIIPNSRNGKNTWVYSSELKKIFIDIGSPFPIDFKITGEPNDQLYIRATPVFSKPQHSQDLVYRCIQHAQAMEKSNIGIPEHIFQHIIRCQNASALYIGNKDKNERLSVIIPLSEPQTGTQSVREMYVFLCKTSCTSGMNRRPIEVIFTLEDMNGRIMGRKVMNVRICSCPKRDKDKEEKEFEGKDTEVVSKKRRRDRSVLNSVPHALTPDTTAFQLNLTVLGHSNAESVIKYCHDLMAGEAVRYAGTPYEAVFKKHLFQTPVKLDRTHKKKEKDSSSSSE